MNRLFGTGNKAPPQTLGSLIKQKEERIADIDVRLKKASLEAKEKGRELREAAPSRKARLKGEFARLITRRNALEDQRMKQQSQLDTLVELESGHDTVKEAAETVKSIKTSTKTLGKELAKVDIDEIERIQDELADLTEMSNEIQEALSRGIGMPEEIDESELDAELDALGEEADYEFELQSKSTAPGFLEEEVPEFIDEPPQTVDKGKLQEVAR